MKSMAIFLITSLVCIGLACAASAEKPVIKKLGTIDCDIVETTPIVFNGKLYRFEYIRAVRYKENTTGNSFFRFVDVATGKRTASFAPGYHLGSAHVEGDTVYVYGVKEWGDHDIDVFWSKDMKTWQSERALNGGRWAIFNTSVCKAGNEYVMAVEISEPAEEVGSVYTMRFAKSNDLIHWTMTPVECVYSKEKYTACPCLYFIDGQFYMIYLESKPGVYVTHIVRSPDLVKWESSRLNPFLEPSDDDKKIANSRLTLEQRKKIAGSENTNNSDVDICEFNGKTIINYSWGNQNGTEYLAAAEYDGPLAQFLKAWFPKSK